MNGGGLTSDYGCSKFVTTDVVTTRQGKREPGMLKKHHGLLGELELDILKLIWQTPGSTVQELVDLIATERQCARTTVLTVVQRLHAKGFLTRKKVDGVFRFWGKEEQSKVMSRLIGQFVEKVLDGSAAPFVKHT